MAHVAEDVADLAFDLVAVGDEEQRRFQQECRVGDHLRDLLLRARADVGQDPAGLAPHCLLLVVQQRLQQREAVAGQQRLCLGLIAVGDVAHDAQAGNQLVVLALEAELYHNGQEIGHLDHPLHS